MEAVMIDVDNWGATDEERARHYPADDYLPDPVRRMDRAVTVYAPAPLVYRWMCQLQLAPYSYDWIDNWGKRSPTELVPGSDQLKVGEPLMIFRLTDIQPGRQFSARSRRAEHLFGQLAVTYAVEPVNANESRLCCRIIARNPGFLGGIKGYLLSWGDLVMMRKQLLTFKKYAERDSACQATER
jgi:hypothetical protein